MGLFKKFELHFGDKYIATQMQGAKLGADITKDMGTAAQIAGFAGGIVFGTVIGIIRFWNPADIYDSLLTPEDDLQERIEKKMASVK